MDEVDARLEDVEEVVSPRSPTHSTREGESAADSAGVASSSTSVLLEATMQALQQQVDSLQADSYKASQRMATMQAEVIPNPNLNPNRIATMQAEVMRTAALATSSVRRQQIPHTQSAGRMHRRSSSKDSGLSPQAAPTSLDSIEQYDSHLEALIAEHERDEMHEPHAVDLKIEALKQAIQATVQRIGEVKIGEGRVTYRL